MIVLLNQVLSCENVLSGGEKISVEFIRKWKARTYIKIIMPENGKKRIQEVEGLDAEFDTFKFYGQEEAVLEVYVFDPSGLDNVFN